MVRRFGRLAKTLFCALNPLKLALAQLNPKVGDIDGNLESILNAYRKSSDEGVDLVVCSEMALLGYPPKDLLDRKEVIEYLEVALKRLAAEVNRTGLLVGTVRPNPSPKGRPLINAAVLLAEGEILETFSKTLLPSYDVFDEDRYFEPGTNSSVIDFRGKRMGITICEDIWNLSTQEIPYHYNRDPLQAFQHENLDILINLSASPFHAGKYLSRMRVLSELTQKYSWPIVYVNQVGSNDELIFDGQSVVLSADGEILAKGAAFEEDLVLVDLDQASPIQISSIEPTEEIVEALTLGIKDYLRKCGFKKAVLGLSGGIDSSVVACLAVRALGPENVWGIAMPSKFNLNASLEDARTLANNLNFRFDVLSIQEIFEQYQKSLDPIFSDLPSNVAEENIQARIRGNLLMALSNKFGHILLTTGNKSELAVGYCTLYGDMCGGLAVISDVPKGLVFEIAKWFNREKEIIPQRILERPPSAELRPNQIDQDSLPEYDLLDKILVAFIEEGRTAEELVSAGHNPDVVAHVLQLINRNEYKRFQAAPGLRVTSKAFGSGRRMPIAKSSKLLMPK